MTISFVYIPIKRKLYDDIVRFSDGKVDPAFIAEVQLENWIERDLQFGIENNWGNRFEEVAEIYAPHLLEVLLKDKQKSMAKLVNERKPLVWKEVSISAGSEVRMSYNNNQHYAIVKDGRIVDEDGAYSPSDWASKVARGTSRNAWRDLWFREPLSKSWIPAQLLRDQAIEELKQRTPDAGGVS